MEHTQRFDPLILINTFHVNANLVRLFMYFERLKSKKGCKKAETYAIGNHKEFKKNRKISKLIDHVSIFYENIVNLEVSSLNLAVLGH